MKKGLQFIVTHGHCTGFGAWQQVCRLVRQFVDGVFLKRNMYFDDLKLGMTVQIAPAVIHEEKMLSFARDYDNIPLHTDAEYAKTTPFGKLIAPGVMSFMSVWAKYLEIDFFGRELLAGKSTKIEWIKPVYAEDVLTGKATVTNLVKRSAKNGIVEITIEAYNQKGETVLTDVTEAIVKCRKA